MRWITPYLLSSPAVILFLLLLLGPIVLLSRMSLYEQPSNRGYYTPSSWSLANFEKVLDSHGQELLAFTFSLAAVVAVLTLLIAFPLALFIDSLSPTSRRFALCVILLPKLASVLVVYFGWQQILSASGPISQLLEAIGIVSGPVTFSRSFLAASVGESYLIIPYAVLVLALQLHAIDPSLADAARGLGASSWFIFRRITLPLVWPALLLALELALMWGMGAFLGPMFLGGPEQTTLSIEIHRQAFEYSSWPRAGADAIVLMLATLSSFAALNVLSRFLRNWQ